MNKKDINMLLSSMGIYDQKELGVKLNIEDDTHFTNYKEQTVEIKTDNGLSSTDIIIALLAKQTQYIQTIKNICVCCFVCSIIAAILLIIDYL